MKEKIFVKHFNITKSKFKITMVSCSKRRRIKKHNSYYQKINNEKKLWIFNNYYNIKFGQLAETKFKIFKNVKHRFMPSDVNYIIEKFLNEWKPEKDFSRWFWNLAKFNFKSKRT